MSNYNELYKSGEVQVTTTMKSKPKKPSLLKRFTTWVKSLFTHKTIKYTVQDMALAPEPTTFRATKAYADQRQKATHNRKHKPNKAMRNLYNLR